MDGASASRSMSVQEPPTSTAVKQIVSKSSSLDREVLNSLETDPIKLSQEPRQRSSSTGNILDQHIEDDDELNLPPQRVKSEAKVGRQEPTRAPSEDGADGNTTGQASSNNNGNSPPTSAKRALKSVGKAFRKMTGKSGTRRKGHKFFELFPDLPKDDIHVNDYNCALQKEILIQGRLHVTSTSVCFYSNILGWETSQMIPYDDVTNISKENTLNFIPNAIQICTKSSKYTFASFLNRDRCYRCLFTLWQYSLMQEKVSEEIIEALEERDWQGGSQIRTPNSPNPTRKKKHNKKEKGKEEAGSGLKQDVSSSSNVADAARPQEQPRTKKPVNRKIELSEEEEEEEESDTLPNSETPSLSIDLDYSEGETSCPCQSHLVAPLHESIVPCSVDNLYRLIFQDTNWFLATSERRNVSEVEFGKWKQKGKHKERTVTYTLALDYAIGPKSAPAIEEQKLISMDHGKCYVLETDVRTPTVPYGQSFLCRSRYCLTRRGPGEAFLRVTGEVAYLKSVWSLTKAFIEKTSFDGMRSYWDDASIAMKEVIIQDLNDQASLSSSQPSTHDNNHSNNEKMKRSVSMTSIPSIFSMEPKQKKKRPAVLIQIPEQIREAALIIILFLFLLLFYRIYRLESELYGLKTDLQDQIRGLACADKYKE